MTNFEINGLPKRAYLRALSDHGLPETGYYGQKFFDNNGNLFWVTASLELRRVHVSDEEG